MALPHRKLPAMLFRETAPRTYRFAALPSSTSFSTPRRVRLCSRSGFEEAGGVLTSSAARADGLDKTAPSLAVVLCDRSAHALHVANLQQRCAWEELLKTCCVLSFVRSLNAKKRQQKHPRTRSEQFRSSPDCFHRSWATNCYTLFMPGSSQPALHYIHGLPGASLPSVNNADGSFYGGRCFPP